MNVSIHKGFIFFYFFYFCALAVIGSQTTAENHSQCNCIDILYMICSLLTHSPPLSCLKGQLYWLP